MNNLDSLLSNYKGTLSVKDQTILLELKDYDQANLINEDGFIEIGKYRNRKETSNKATESKEEDKKRSEQRPLIKFLKQFKQPLIKSSIFNFPLDIELDKLYDYDQECLDPRFLLLSFYQLINNNRLTLDEFIDNNCLAITFVSLSFKDVKLRRIAYLILVKFKMNLCNGVYGQIWRIILDKLSASLKEDNQLIEPLLASFFVHLIPLIKNPTYSIYEQLATFLQNYSTFKSNSIVGFLFSMLIADDLEQNSFYQEIALRILKNGLKTEYDFNLCLHCRIIDFLLINFNSPVLFKQNLKCKVLDVFQLIIKIESATKLLCTEKAFLLWLNQLIIEESNHECLYKINEIINELNEFNYNFYHLYPIELKMIRSVCTRKIDNLFEQEM